MPPFIMRHKVEVPPCRYCNRRFARREHLRRHERTHTKEKPHICKCGKTFTRRDLIVRHIRLVDNSTEHVEVEIQQSNEGRPSPSPSILGPGDAEAFELDGEAESSTASVHVQDALPDLGSQYPQPNPSTDLDMLWENLDFHQDTVDYSFYNSGMPLDFQSLEVYGISEAPLIAVSDPSLEVMQTPQSPDGEDAWPPALSGLASRLPSLQPPDGNGSPSSVDPKAPLPNQKSRGPGDKHTTKNPWHVSRDAFDQIRARVDAERHLLPPGFQMPSKHAISRFAEGFSGFQCHLPFLHLPTLQIAGMSLELFLAVIAIGAQFRFERQAARSLAMASKQIIDARLSDLSQVMMDTDIGTVFQQSPMNQTPRSASNTLSDRTATLPCQQHTRVRLAEDTVQAMIIIMSFCTWNSGDLLPIAFTLGEQLANCLRQDGYLDDAEEEGDASWSRWIQLEGRRRTVLVIFLLLNLHTVIYNVPPRLMNREIRFVRMPQSELQWRAWTAEDWASFHHGSSLVTTSFGNCFLGLFKPENNSNHETSAFGNLITIHGLLQQIHLAWESHVDFDWDNNKNTSSSLPQDVAAKFQSALRQWQHNWTINDESSSKPGAPSGPLGFNASALFRVACIRVSFNIGPYRGYESRDPVKVTTAFSEAPCLKRSPQLYAAVLQSAHALSIPVRAGIQYVAKTQALKWSLVHSLCNLECALFLSKWLFLLSLSDQSLTEEEQRLLHIIAKVLRETPFFEPLLPNVCSGLVMKQMSYAVIRLVAETLRSAHVFDLMDSVEAAADCFAFRLEREYGLVP